jgi:hypothetical protein
MTPKQAGWGEEIADVAVKAAEIANREAKSARAARARAEEIVPDPHKEMLRALAGREQAALLRIGPRRNRWQDLLAYEERLLELEQRRTALHEEIAALNLQLQEEPGRHTAALAAWMEAGERDERPVSRVPELQAALADRQAEYEAAGLRYDQTLRERAEHVMRNRSRFVRDVAKAKEEAAANYRRLVDELEGKRREVLDLRATEVWAGLFPSEALQNQPNVQTLVGARKSVQEPLLPGVQAGLAAENVFALLRRDVEFCADVATADQYAALTGVSLAKLTGREARWQEGKTDFVGPSFEAAWRGSAEEAANAERLRKYSESLRRQLWGNS